MIVSNKDYMEAQEKAIEEAETVVKLHGSPTTKMEEPVLTTT